MARILIIDDDAEMRSSLIQNLSGHTILEARSGVEGLRRLKQEPVDLVIMNLFMPALDGFITIAELRSEDPEVKIVVISEVTPAYKESSLNMAAYLGARHTLTKPFSTQEFHRVIEEVLQN